MIYLSLRSWLSIYNCVSLRSVCSVSLLTLTAISVDRLLALLLGLRYRQVVTLKRTYFAVIVFWLVPIVGASTYFWNPLITRWCGNIATLLCLATSISVLLHANFSYSSPQPKSSTKPRFSRTTEPSNSTEHSSIQKGSVHCTVGAGTGVVCYLPTGIVIALTPPRGLLFFVYLAWQHTVSLVFLNSSLRPLLYCWKITEVRQAVKDTIRQLCCSST